MSEKWVRELTEEFIDGSTLTVGAIVKHPDGRTVKITSGQYWGTHGVSNFWYWREVKPDGSLGEEEHGYGWEPDPPEEEG